MSEKTSWLKEAFNTQWRWNRKKFILFQIVVFITILLLIFLLVFGYIFTQGQSNLANILFFIWLLVILIPGTYIWILSYMKRLRDIWHTPWLSIISIIPYISFVFLFYCAVRKGTVGENKYGPDPLGWTAATKKSEEKIEESTEL